MAQELDPKRVLEVRFDGTYKVGGSPCKMGAFGHTKSMIDT